MKKFTLVGAAIAAAAAAGAAFALLGNQQAPTRDAYELYTEGRQLFFEGQIEESGEVLALAVKGLPNTGEAWFYFGLSKHHAKEFDAARKAFLKSSDLNYRQQLSWYNIACGYALQGRDTDAFDALEKAIDFGRISRSQITSDPDLRTLRADPRFTEIIAELKSPLQGIPAAEAMDLLIGTWEVYDEPTEKWLGTMQAQHTLNGYGVEQQWTNYSGSHSWGMYTYIAPEEIWVQLQSDQDGTTVRREGVLVEGVLTFTGSCLHADGKVEIDSIEWAAQEDGSILEERIITTPGSSTGKKIVLRFVPQDR
jgi:tetratricopeptide (TPR) repeat protein